jgi:hypothetical protein
MCITSSFGKSTSVRLRAGLAWITQVSVPARPGLAELRAAQLTGAVSERKISGA